MQPNVSTKVICLLLPVRERAREVDESDNGSSAAPPGHSRDPSSTVARRNTRLDDDSNSLTDSFASLISDDDWLLTRNGDTPLHLAIRHTLSSHVVAHIETALPQTIDMENQEGLTPRQLKERIAQAQDRHQTVEHAQ